MPKIIKPAKGSYTAASITVDSSGRVITASSGAGAANMVFTEAVSAPLTGANGTFTAQNNTNKIIVYMRGAGGASGNLEPGPGWVGGGGLGGFGVLATPISQPYSVPYALGAGGNIGNARAAGNAGTASTFNTNFVANAGNGGQRGPNPAAGGTIGDCTGATLDLSVPGNGYSGGGNGQTNNDGYFTSLDRFYTNPMFTNTAIDYGNTSNYPQGVTNYEAGMGGKAMGPGNTLTGNVGMGGAIKIYEDIG